MPQETELKLELHRDDLPRLLAHPLLSAQPPRRERLLNTYYDTSTLALRAQRLAVRERRVGRRTLLTVKTAGTSVGGLSRRGEWEAACRPGSFDFAALIDDDALAQQLVRVAWQLVPVFRTDFTRRSWQLRHGGAVVEVALDQGFITTGNAEGNNHRQAILEVELELLSGPVAELFDLAHTLALGPKGRAECGLRLLPTNRSKAERGYALFVGERLRPVKASPVELDAGLHPVQAFRVAALSCLAHLQANEAGVVLPSGSNGAWPDPEFVHQARVALRRLRTGLRLFRAHLPSRFVEHWAGEWKALAGQLGEARNWDVLATERLPEWVPEPVGGGARDPAALAVLDWVQGQRRAAGQRAADALGASAHALRLLAFTHAVLCLLPPDAPTLRDPTDTRLADWARGALRERHAALREEAHRARRAGPEGRHALRIALKKLRYAQEFLTSLLPPKRVQRSTAALADAQELLGELNDLSTAHLLLADVPPGPAAPLVQRWRDALQAQLQTRLQELPEMERALERAPAPWD